MPGRGKVVLPTLISLRGGGSDTGLAFTVWPIILGLSRRLFVWQMGVWVFGLGLAVFFATLAVQGDPNWEPASRNPPNPQIRGRCFTGIPGGWLFFPRGIPGFLQPDSWDQPPRDTLNPTGFRGKNGLEPGWIRTWLEPQRCKTTQSKCRVPQPNGWFMGGAVVCLG